MVLNNETKEIIHTDGPWHDLLGWSPSHMDQLKTRMHEDDQHHISRMTRLDTRNTYTRVERERGGYVWLQWHSKVDEDYTCLAATEQTDMYTSLNSLRETENRYKQMVQYAGHFWMMHDEQGRIVQGNQAILESLGYTAQEFEQMHVYDIDMTVQQQSLTGIWNRMPPNHTITINGRHRRKDGTTYPVEMKLRKFTQNSQTLVSAVGRDISKDELVASHLSSLNAQLKHSRDRAVRDKALQNDFIAAIAQSMSTPLSAIMGYAQMVREDVSHEPLLVHHLNQILVSADQMGILFDDLFELSSLQANTIEFELMRVRAKDLIQECQDVFGPQAKHKGLEFNVQVKDELEVEVDVNKIRQALSCLISNALTYTSAGHINVEVKQHTPHHVLFVVEDTGEGFTQEQRARVFEPFHPTNQAKLQERGNGLSLGICKLIFTRMGGDLTLTSQPGEGSRFEGLLPVKLKQMVNLTSIEGINILVVSQDDRLIEKNRHMLLGVDAHIIEAPDYYSALERARTLTPQLILIHLDGDSKDANKLMRQLLIDPNTAHIPVIIRGVEEEQEALRRSGALIQLPNEVPEHTVLHRIQSCMATSNGHILVTSPLASTREIILRSLAPLDWQEQGVSTLEHLNVVLAPLTLPCIVIVDAALFDEDAQALSTMMQAHPKAHYIVLSDHHSAIPPEGGHVVMTQGMYTLGQLIRTISRMMFEFALDA